jgi:hypothetical protein
MDTTQIPYLSSFIAFEPKARPETSNLAHSPIPLFPVALKGFEKGYRHCLRDLSASLPPHHTLCETHDFLGIEVLGGQSLDDVVTDLKVCK